MPLLSLVLVACGVGGVTQVGEPPTREWAEEMQCPPNVSSLCSGRQLTLFSTVNDPAGTTYGISSSDDDVFVICRWPIGAAGVACEPIPEAGARVVGEAAAYRVDG